MAVKEASSARPSARERLLAAANELFYNEGVHTVGIDRVIEQAGVAKASLYNTFGSKDELVRAYLETRHATVTQRITQAVERYDTPRERLLAVFEGQGELFAQPDYRGCAFARASAESHPGDLAEQAAEAYRRWVRALLTELAAQAGVPEPEVLARQLHLLYDGSGQAARMDHDPAAAAAARAAAAVLLDAALACGAAALPLVPARCRQAPVTPATPPAAPSRPFILHGCRDHCRSPEIHRVTAGLLRSPQLRVAQIVVEAADRAGVP